jgi:uncharacterized protein
MQKQSISIGAIPTIIWGTPSEQAYIFVHGRMSRKEDAEGFANIAEAKGYQVISFDLPAHGERTVEDYPCTVQNAVHDLRMISDFVAGKWRAISLFGSSLGAYFSLVAYSDLRFGNCLFISPILDMKRLIQGMMERTGVNEESLRERQEILTPLGETLSWSYYSFVMDNPIAKWNSPTHILYGANDELTPREVVDTFVASSCCTLDVIPDGEHYFHTQGQMEAVDKWVDIYT